MKIKKGDNVIVLSGKSRGTKGKVTHAFPGENRVIVEGANIGKHRERPRKQGEKGQTIERAMPLAVSNVAIYCEGCGQGVRAGYEVKGKTKTRVCRSCGKEL